MGLARRLPGGDRAGVRRGRTVRAGARARSALGGQIRAGKSILPCQQGEIGAGFQRSLRLMSAETFWKLAETPTKFSGIVVASVASKRVE
jgi:hypothetical protein